VLLDSNDNRSRPLKIKTIKPVIKLLSPCLVWSLFFSFPLIFALYVLPSAQFGVLTLVLLRGSALYHHTCPNPPSSAACCIVVCVCFRS